MTVDIGIAQSHVPFKNKPVHNAMGAVDRNRFREVRSDVYLPTAVDQQQPSFEVDRIRLNSRWGIWKLTGRVIRHGESFEDFGLFASPRRHQWWRPATWPISQQIKLAAQWYRGGVKEKVAEMTPEQRAQFSVTALLAQQERYEAYITAILEAKTDVPLHPAEVKTYLEGLVELYPNLPVDLVDNAENADTLDTQQTAFSALRAAQEGPPGGSEEHPQEEVVEARVDAVLQDAVPTIFPNAPQDDLRGKSKAVDEALQDTTQEELAASLGEQPSLVDTDAESKSVGLPDAETEAPAFDEQVNRKDRDNVLAELKEDGAFNHMPESWRKQFITDLEQGGLTYKELYIRILESTEFGGENIPELYSLWCSTKVEAPWSARGTIPGEFRVARVRGRRLLEGESGTRLSEKFVLTDLQSELLLRQLSETLFQFCEENKGSELGRAGADVRTVWMDHVDDLLAYMMGGSIDGVGLEKWLKNYMQALEQLVNSHQLVPQSQGGSVALPAHFLELNKLLSRPEVRELRENLGLNR